MTATRVMVAPPVEPVSPGAAPLAILLDYDGTVAQTDVGDMVMAEHVTAEWEPIVAAYDQGRIGSRRTMEAELSLLRATESALLIRLCIEAGWPFERWTELSEIEAWPAQTLDDWRRDLGTLRPPAARPFFCWLEIWGEDRTDPPPGAWPPASMRALPLQRD